MPATSLLALIDDIATILDDVSVMTKAVADPAVDRVTAERDKIKGAVRTDSILSAEIIAITLRVVAQQPLPQQLAVLGGVATLMSIGVYGLVAGIVKLDDLGLQLASVPSAAPAAVALIVALATTGRRLVGGAGHAA